MRCWRATVTRWCAAALVALLVGAACSTPERNRGSRQADRQDPTSTAPAAEPERPATTTSTTAPRQDAVLTGRIVGPDGEPRSGVPVTVVEARSGIGLDGALAAIFTAGLACIAAPDLCGGGERVVDAGTTDAEGRYELTLPRAYLPGFETDEDWVLQVGRAPGPGELTGPASSYELEVNTARQEAPDLAVWDGTPAVTADGPLLQVSVPPLSGGASLEQVATRFVDERGGVLWGVSGTTVDPRVLEDRPTRLVASGRADVRVRHDDGRTIYHQRVATATVPHIGTLVPPSRGKPCTASDGAIVGCPFTDGDLHAATDLGPDAAVTVDLGVPTDLGLVLVRGTSSHLRDDVVIEHSADAGTWTTSSARRLDGTNGWSFGPAAGDGAPTARYLRVQGMQTLAEVSVWPPSEIDRALAGRGRSGSGGEESGREVPWGLAVAAGALVLGVGALLVRHRHRGRI